MLGVRVSSLREDAEGKRWAVLINLHLCLLPSAHHNYYLICSSPGCWASFPPVRSTSKRLKVGRGEVGIFPPPPFSSCSRATFLAVNALLQFTSDLLLMAPACMVLWEHFLPLGIFSRSGSLGNRLWYSVCRRFAEEWVLGVATWGGEVREAGLGRICWDGPAVSCHNWASGRDLYTSM